VHGKKKYLHRNKKKSSFPRKRESILHFPENFQTKMDYAPLLRRALRAIRQANVRFGILPPQSRFRGNDVSLFVFLL
jgi:hypothetical protein